MANGLEKPAGGAWPGRRESGRLWDGRAAAKGERMATIAERRESGEGAPSRSAVVATFGAPMGLAKRERAAGVAPRDADPTDCKRRWFWRG